MAAIGKKLLPHVAIILIFFTVTCLYMGPVLSGKVMKQHDVNMFSGSFQEVKEYQQKTGERSLWTNSMFGGMPTYNIAPYSPNNMLGTGWIWGALVSGHSLPVPMNVFFLYCLAFYLLMLSFRINPWISMIGALAFAFSSFNTIILEAGHMLQAYALATGPLALAAAVYTIRFRKYFLGGALFSLAMALHLRTNHPQMNYYFVIIIGLFLIAELIYHIREKQWAPFLKSMLALGIGGAFAVGTYITYFLTTNEYSKVSTRGKTELKGKSNKDRNAEGLNIDYAFDYSYGVGETFTMMIPDFRGGAAAAIGNEHKNALKGTEPELRQEVLGLDEYWGEDSGAGPYYFGAIICFLFVLGLLMLKSHYKWWVLAVTVFAIMLSWGKNFLDFNSFIFYHFPLYDKFRSVNFTLFMAAVAMPILAIMALNKILNGIEWDKKTLQKLYIAFGITGGLCLIFWILPTLAGDFSKPNNMDANIFQGQKVPQQTQDLIIGALQDARTEILRADAIRSFIFILLAGLTIFLYARKWQFFGQPSGKNIAIAIFFVLILVDQWSVDKRYLTDKNFESKKTQSYDPTDADNYILQDKDPDYRVLNLLSMEPSAPYNDASTSYFHKSMGGYSGAKIRRFQDIAEKYLYNLTGVIDQNATKMPPEQLMSVLQQTRKLGVLNMMDCKYIIAGENAKDVITNPYHLDHAWFVKGLKLVADADTELGSIEGFNPADTAIVDIGNNHPEFKSYLEGFTPRYDPTATIKLDEYKPNYLKYTTNAATEQFAVFSEVYYNSGLGWQVYIDGKKSEHIRVNYLIRGMRVPAGAHTIEFKFAPPSFEKGEKIALVSSMLMLFGLLGSAGWEIFRGMKKEDETTTPPEEVV